MSTEPKVTKTTEKVIKLSVIAEAAEEINKLLTPDPLIDLASDAQIKKDLVELIPSIQPDDDLSDATKKVLTDLGWGKKAPKVVVEKPSATKALIKGAKVGSVAKGGAEKSRFGHRGVSAVALDGYVGSKKTISVATAAKELGLSSKFVFAHLTKLTTKLGLEAKITD